MTSTRSSMTFATGPAEAVAGPDQVLGIPRHLWSAPVSEGRRPGPPPRLTRLVWLAPMFALISAYLAAAAALHGHVHAAGWLLASAIAAILAGAVVIAVHGHRAARYRAETPR